MAIISARYAQPTDSGNSRDIEFTHDLPIPDEFIDCEVRAGRIVSKRRPTRGQTVVDVNENAPDWLKELRSPSSVSWLSNPANVITPYETPAEETARLLQQAKDSKRQEIENVTNLGANLFDEILTADSGKGASNPTVVAYAAERGIAVGLALNEMKAAREANETNMGKKLGRRRNYLNSLDSATTVAQVDAITVDYEAALAPFAPKNNSNKT